MTSTATAEEKIYVLDFDNRIKRGSKRRTATREVPESQIAAVTEELAEEGWRRCGVKRKRGGSNGHHRGEGDNQRRASKPRHPRR
ncbi:MAG: hypothetical protein CMI53_04355 [Parcubacteria group bacterium]|nr:hypothetical protein [Parcubacteria group bacterium]|tara:strand:- start:207 stop:461 length:255 start_codon:yes stop_codon:yes gene_type:complete